jgi:hypothetical protein
MLHENATTPTTLPYGARPRRRLVIFPLVIAAVHFSVASAMYWYCFYRFVFIGYAGGPGGIPLVQAPPRTMLNSVFEFALKGLMLPVPDVESPIIVFRQAYYIMAVDSLCWAVVSWYVVRVVRHLRRAA